MNELPQLPRYFLGANSDHGFYSLFEQVYDPADGWRVILLKGGPGSGKSTLMKRCAQAMTDVGLSPELCYCSSDPRSLDAVILPKQKVYIADGTAPHKMEPRLPGACESLFDPGVCWDTEKLYSRREAILRLNSRIARQHRRSQRFVAAAGSLLAENRRLEEECLRSDALRAYAQRLGKRLFPKRLLHTGSETRRFLSGITPSGIISFDDTLSALAKQIIYIDDESGAAATILLEELRQSALHFGHSIIVCPCPLSPNEKLDALILPELSLAFLVSNSFHRPSITADRMIHIRRFLDLHRYSENHARIRFDRRAARELLAEAISALQNALSLHDELEEIYMAAMDFTMMDQQTEDLIYQLKKYL